MHRDTLLVQRTYWNRGAQQTSCKMIHPIIILLLFAGSPPAVSYIEVSVLEGSSVTIYSPYFGSKWWWWQCWTIFNVQPQDSGAFYCVPYRNKRYWLFKLKVVRACERDLMHHIDFKGNNIDSSGASGPLVSHARDCEKLSTQAQNCQYFTVSDHGRCYLKASLDSERIKYNSRTSCLGYSLRNCSGGVNNTDEDHSWTATSTSSPDPTYPVGLPTSSPSSTSPIGQSTSSSSPTSPIGQPTSSPSSTSPIGQSTSSSSPTSPIGQPTSSSSPTSPIGQSTSSSSPTSPIGQPTSSSSPTSPIGQPTSSSSPTSPIGQPTSSPSSTSPIGQSTSSSSPTSPIGQSTSSSSPTSPIGQPTSSSSPTSPIGQPTSSPSSTSPIGQSTSSSSPTSPIGQPTSSSSPTSPIGQPTSSSSPTSPIGQSTSSSSPTSPIGQPTSSSSPTSPIGQSTSSSSPTSPALSSTEGKTTSFLSSTATSSGHNDYLKFFIGPKSWINALRFCEKLNSSLVHITNETVQDHVTRLLVNKDLPHGVWIGLERSIFQWSAPWVWTGGPVVVYEQWHDCFPRSPPNFHCGKIIREDDHLRWLDACCHAELPFICQDRPESIEGPTCLN